VHETIYQHHMFHFNVWHSKATSSYIANNLHEAKILAIAYKKHSSVYIPDRTLKPGRIVLILPRIRRVRDGIFHTSPNQAADGFLRVMAASFSPPFCFPDMP
jgi:hypothetical protein